MRILVTRPQPDADRTAATLGKLGVETVVAPLMTVRTLAATPPDPGQFQALLFTSANAIRVYAGLGGPAEGKVLAVGDATAAAAREFGFTDVLSAGGDAAALVDLVERTLSPAGGPLAHLRGEDVAGGGFGELSQAGYAIEPVILYRAEMASSLPQAALSAIRTRTIDGVTLYSPRSARTFMELILKAGLGDACRRLTAFCLSDAVAAVLERPGLAVAWGRIYVAASPTEASLIKLFAPAPSTNPPPGNPTMTAPILNNAEAIIAAFGGIRPMAKKLGVAVTTVQGWKERGSIPVARLDQIKEAADREGIDLKAPDPGTAASAPEAERPAGNNGGPWKSADAAKSPAGEPAKPAAQVRAERVEQGPDVGVKASPGSPPPPSIDHPARDRGGWTRPFAFGAGVAIVLAIGIFLGWFLGPERPGTASVETQNRLVATLDRTSATIADLEKRLATAQRENAALAKRAAEQDSRLSAVEKKAAAPGGEVAGETVSALQAKIEKAIGEAAAAQTALNARLAKLEDRIAKLPVAGDQEAVTRIRAATEALQKKLGEIEANVAKVPGGDAVKAAADQAAAAEKSAAAVKAQLDTATAARQKLAEQVAALAARLEDAAGNRSAALVAAIGQVRSQALSGRPFAPELETARGLAKDQPAIAGLLDQLAAPAKTGVPTVQSLAGDFQSLASQIIRAAREAEGGDWLDRAWGRLRSTVVIRRTGDSVKGDTAEALVARAEAALKKGALAEAVKLVAAVPDAARAPAEAWLKQARARLAVEAASEALGRETVKLAAGRTGSKN